MDDGRRWGDGEMRRCGMRRWGDNQISKIQDEQDKCNMQDATDQQTSRPAANINQIQILNNNE